MLKGTSHVSIVSKYSVPPLKRSHQTSKWMVVSCHWCKQGAAVPQLRVRLADLCASLNSGIYRSARNKHLHCITSKRRLRVWKNDGKSLRYGKRTAIRFVAWPWHTTKMSNSARALSPQGWTVFQSLKAASISCIGSWNRPCKVLHGNVGHAKTSLLDAECAYTQLGNKWKDLDHALMAVGNGYTPGSLDR